MVEISVPKVPKMVENRCQVEENGKKSVHSSRSGGGWRYGWSLAVNIVDSYHFGQIVIGGKKYSSDVIIFPDRVLFLA